MTDPTHDGRAAGAGYAHPAVTAAPPPPSPRRAAVRLRALLAAALLLPAALASACGAASTSGGDGQRELSVFAAASLTEAFTELGARFTAAHPDAKVTFAFAASSDLVTQLQQGAPADVLATADTSNMDKVASITGAPQAFAGNRLVIAVEPGNPKQIARLADLADDDLKVVLAAPEVPAGKYAQEALTRAGVTVEPVSLEVSVKGVVTKVSLGEADAGIAYVTDVDAAQGKIDGVAIPADQNVTATYPIATLDDAASPGDAQAFVDLVLSPEGQKVLAEYGFLPAP